MGKNKFRLFLIIILAAFISVFYVRESRAQAYCQQINSQNSAILRGQITDNGGEPNMTVWFTWRIFGDIWWNRTPSQNVNATPLPFNFSFQLTGLQPCTAYEYRAVARNSAGEVEGNTVCFRTLCNPLTISCSSSPNPARINQLVTFTSNVSGGQPPYSYDWSGACNGSGSTCTTSFNSTGNFTAHLTVQDAAGNIKTTQCSVVVQGGLPQVITLPPVETL